MGLQHTIGRRSEAAALFNLSGAGATATMGTRLAISAPIFLGRRDAAAAYVEGQANEPLETALMASRATLLGAGMGPSSGSSADLEAEMNKMKRQLGLGELTPSELADRAEQLSVELDRLNVAQRDEVVQKTRLSIRSGIVTGNLIDRLGRNLYVAMREVERLRDGFDLTAEERQRMQDLEADLQRNETRIQTAFDLYLQVHTDLARSVAAFVSLQLRETGGTLTGQSADVFGKYLESLERHHREIRKTRGQVTEDMRGRWLNDLDEVQTARQERFPELQR